MHALKNRIHLSENTWRVFKFCCVGVLNTGLAFFLYLLFSVFLTMYQANALSWGIACVFSYRMNKSWTFRAADTGFAPLFRFVAVNLCSLGLGLMAMYVLASFGGGRIWSYIFSLLVTTVASYLGYRYWSFKNVDGRAA